MKQRYEQDQVVTRGEASAPSGPANAKERIYEKLRMPLWVLDTILVLLGIAVVVFIVLGMIRGRAG